MKTVFQKRRVFYNTVSFAHKNLLYRYCTMHKHYISIALTVAALVVVVLFAVCQASRIASKPKPSNVDERPTRRIQKRHVPAGNLMEKYQKSRAAFLEALREYFVSRINRLKSCCLGDAEKTRSYFKKYNGETLVSGSRGHNDGARHTKRDLRPRNTSASVKELSPPLNVTTPHLSHSMKLTGNGSGISTSPPLVLQLQYKWGNSSPFHDFKFSEKPKIHDGISSTFSALKNQLSNITVELFRSDVGTPIIQAFDEYHNNFIWFLIGWLYLGVLILFIYVTAFTFAKLMKTTDYISSSTLRRTFTSGSEHNIDATSGSSLEYACIDLESPSPSCSLISLKSVLESISLSEETFASSKSSLSNVDK